MTTPLLQYQDESGDDEDLEDDEEEDLLLPRMGMQAEKSSIFSLNRSVILLTFLSAVGGFLFGYVFTFFSNLQKCN